MSELLLKVSSISKTYTLDDSTSETFKDEILARAKGLFKSNIKSQFKEFHALSNISFELERGDVLGIIGENGAGKSTLLKILSEITTPTEGQIEFYGKVAAILEIGTGFHPDLTGRENIYFNGSLMGLSKHEIDDKYESIVDFSGVQEFIDTPVKHYSTGMYVRLAFSISAQLDADIMLLDEVSSVGDIEFRMKSLKKIKELVSDSGVSVILVTHNLNDVMELCNKCMILENGKIKAFGNPIAVAREYYEEVIIKHVNTANNPKNSMENAKDARASNLQGGGKSPSQENSDKGELKTPFLFWSHVESAPGNDVVKLCKLAVHALDKKPEDNIYTPDPIEIELQFWKLQEKDQLEISMVLNDQIGNAVFSTSSMWNCLGDQPDQEGQYISKILIPGNLLNLGIFSLTFAFTANAERIVAKFLKLIYFKISVNEGEKNVFLTHESPGPFRPKLNWQIEKHVSDRKE